MLPIVSTGGSACAWSSRAVATTIKRLWTSGRARYQMAAPNQTANDTMSPTLITCATRSVIQPRNTRPCACTTVGIANVPRNVGAKYVGQNPITTMASIQSPSQTWKRDRTRGGAPAVGPLVEAAVATALRLMAKMHTDGLAPQALLRQGLAETIQGEASGNRIRMRDRLRQRVSAGGDGPSGDELGD